MSQETRVWKLAARAAGPLRARLRAAGYQERPLDHAHFQARGEGTIVSLYRSGKLVVQGKNLDAWAGRFLGEGGGAAAPARKKAGARAGAGGGGADGAPGLDALRAAIGSDEAGKGDTFGGLTVAAVAVQSRQADELVEAGVCDSKTLSAERVRVLAPWIRDHFPHAERVLDPEEYNRAHRDAGSNVNVLLTRLHAEVLRELVAETGQRVVVVDRFSPREPVRAALLAAEPGLAVTEMPRAEAVPAVAAASVLAREAFVRQVEDLSAHFAVDLPLGSGSPVAPALRRFLKVHAREQLRGAVKLHFGNVRKMLDALPWSEQD